MQNFGGVGRNTDYSNNRQHPYNQTAAFSPEVTQTTIK